MMIIDEKGRLFGKVSIIDVAIIAILIAVLAFALVKFGVLGSSSASVNTSGKEQTIEIKFYQSDADSFVTEKVMVGDVLYDDTLGNVLGVVTNVEIGPSVDWAQTDEGTFVKTTKEGKNSIIITGEVKGSIADNGCVINNNRYSVGHSFTLKAGKSKFWLQVYDYNAKE